MADPNTRQPRTRVSNPSAGLGGLFDLMAGGTGDGGSSRGPAGGNGIPQGGGGGSGGRSWTFEFPGGGHGSVTFGSVNNAGVNGLGGGFNLFGEPMGTGPNQNAGLDA